ncbi:MAG TPA: hypothetical protein VGJ14_07495, partial [Sporichthyaceae bacterium]
GLGMSLACAIDGIAIEATIITDATITVLRMAPPAHHRPTAPVGLPATLARCRRNRWAMAWV